jgi:hypothetical protein
VVLQLDADDYRDFVLRRKRLRGGNGILTGRGKGGRRGVQGPKCSNGKSARDSTAELHSPLPGCQSNDDSLILIRNNLQLLKFFGQRRQSHRKVSAPD